MITVNSAGLALTCAMCKTRTVLALPSGMKLPTEISNIMAMLGDVAGKLKHDILCASCVAKVTK